MIAVPAVSPALKARDGKGPSSDGDGDGAPLVAHSLRGEGSDASEDGTGRGTPLIPVDYTNGIIGGPVCGTLEAAQARGNRGHGVMAFDPVNVTSKANRTRVEPDRECHTLHSGAPAVAFDWYSSESQGMPVGDFSPPLKTTMQPAASTRSGVRRLTPRECERLQGFPDDYTLITYRKKPAADAPRYRAIGNSMAVNVMRWIGRRIEMIDAMEST